MILGDPYKFAIFIKTIKEWNIDTTFCNGILLFSVNGKIFPKKILTATLVSEINPLIENLKNITIDEEIFNMKKEAAFKMMYNITFPENIDLDNDYRFDITPLSFADDNCYVFAVSNGQHIKILASKLKYILEESIHDLYHAEIIESILSVQELNEMVNKLYLYQL